MERKKTPQGGNVVSLNSRLRDVILAHHDYPTRKRLFEKSDVIVNVGVTFEHALFVVSGQLREEIVCGEETVLVREYEPGMIAFPQGVHSLHRKQPALTRVKALTDGEAVLLERGNMREIFGLAAGIIDIYVEDRLIATTNARQKVREAQISKELGELIALTDPKQLGEKITELPTKTQARKILGLLKELATLKKEHAALAKNTDEFLKEQAVQSNASLAIANIALGYEIYVSQLLRACKHHGVPLELTHPSENLLRLLGGENISEEDLLLIKAEAARDNVEREITEEDLRIAHEDQERPPPSLPPSGPAEPITSKHRLPGEQHGVVVSEDQIAALADISGEEPMVVRDDELQSIPPSPPSSRPPSSRPDGGYAMVAPRNPSNLGPASLAGPLRVPRPRASVHDRPTLDFTAEAPTTVRGTPPSPTTGFRIPLPPAAPSPPPLPTEGPSIEFGEVPLDEAFGGLEPLEDAADIGDDADLIDDPAAESERSTTAAFGLTEDEMAQIARSSNSDLFEQPARPRTADYAMTPAQHAELERKIAEEKAKKKLHGVDSPQRNAPALTLRAGALYFLSLPRRSRTT
jgi:hypothetical protein